MGARHHQLPAARAAIGAVLVIACVATLRSDPLPQGAPTFRASVDLVAVDVQVVDRQGRPVLGLAREDFSVTIAGRRRRVASVDLIRHAGAPQLVEPIAPGAAALEAGVPAATPRHIVIAVDGASFEPSTWQPVAPVLRRYVEELPTSDLVGLYVSPFGPALPPRVDRALLQQAIAAVLPSGAAFRTEFNLRPAEVVDITAESAVLISPSTASLRTRRESFDEGVDARTVERVQLRECPNDPDCRGRILLDAANAVHDLETRAVQSLNGIESMLGTLATWPGRKTVILVSSGVLVSDRPGGRPDAGNLARRLGRQVAESGAAIYTLHLDASFRNTYSATGRRLSVPGADEARETEMQSRWLDQFSDAAGGTLFRVQVDHGEAALKSVMQETAAYYLLGVEPLAADADGRFHPLKVDVARRGVTVRSRRWVAIPDR